MLDELKSEAELQRAAIQAQKQNLTHELQERIENAERLKAEDAQRQQADLEARRRLEEEIAKQEEQKHQTNRSQKIGPQKFKQK